VFFIFAIKSWDEFSGVVSQHKIWFYSLDETSTVLYFCLCSVLASFWAELYHISTNTADAYNNRVRPLTWTINVIALAGVPLCSYAVSKDSDEEASTVFIEYTVFVVIIFSLAATAFTYYAYLAATQLNIAPVQLLTRKSSLLSLRMLGFVCVFALLAKAAVYVSLSGKSVATSSLKSQLFIFAYYMCLEICPVLAVLHYYRVVDAGQFSDDSRMYDDVFSNKDSMFGGIDNTDDSISESDRLLNEKQMYYQSEGREYAVSRDTSNYTKYLDNPGRTAPLSVVDAVIASLSSSTATAIPTAQAKTI
jgi:hypothetical protein